MTSPGYQTNQSHSPICPFLSDPTSALQCTCFTERTQILQRLGRCKDTARRCREEVNSAVRVLRETLHVQLEATIKRIEEYEDMIERAFVLTSKGAEEVEISSELAYYVDTQRAVEGIRKLCLFSNFSIHEDKATMTSTNSDPQGFVIYPSKPIKVEQAWPKPASSAAFEMISDDSSP